MTESQQEFKKRPVIAILTVADGRRPLRGNLHNFIDLMKIGDDMGAIVYVTTVADLKLSQKQILGHAYHAAKKSWYTKMFPLPKVIYNRIPYRKFEMQPEVQQAIQTCLKHRRIQLFNPFFFNKWTLFEWLSQNKTTRSFIPMTEKLSSARNLESLFEHASTLYLKPVRGKAGRGIMRADKKQTAQGTEYWLIHPKQNKRRISKFTSLYDLWLTLKEEIGNTEYIVQQGITLTRFKKRPFDLRLLVQKNHKGAWAVTGIGARVAGKLSITTHVPRGGTIDDPGKLLNHKFGSAKAAKIMQYVGKSALVIARRIERASGHRLGEMSMDLGVDTNGNLWFFEANSKPMKFDEPHIRRKSLERLIQYCIYLSAKNTRHRKKKSGPPL